MKMGYCKTNMIGLPQVLVKMLSFVFLWITSASEASLIVGGDAWVELGRDTTLTCTVPETYSFLEWRVSSPDVTGYDNASIIVSVLGVNGAPPIMYNPSINQSHYTFDNTLGNNALKVMSVTLGDDDKKYWCRALISAGGKRVGTFHSRIRVPPSSIVFEFDGASHNNGASFPVVAGANHQITCTTRGIKPAANFTWTLPTSITTDQPLGSQADTPNSGDSRLTDSTNTITVDIAETPATAQLTCGATNRQDGQTGTELDFTVTIEIRVPPKDVKLSDSDGVQVNNGSRVEINQGTSTSFTCAVLRTRPAATIKWFLGPDDTPDRTTSPPVGSNELVNSTDTWSFIPDRSNHGQALKCVASTAESVQPFPSVMATLEVNGPPDLPSLAGNTVMTENETTQLTCTAGMGYPEDWNLVWSNGGSPITGTNTSSSASGDRYSFTSTLDYTPRRQDNGNIITCKANRAPWTTEPMASLGPINVKFCTLGVSVTDPAAVIEGNPASWSCKSETSNPATDWTWSINDVEQTSLPVTVENDGDHGGKESNATFRTGTLSKVDNGAVLTCCAKKTAQCTDVCSTSVLNVHYAPAFYPLAQPPNPILEGGEVMLTCSVDANPLPMSDIIWEKQGPGTAPTPDMSVYSGGTSNLTLSTIGRQQAGNYSCKANNGIPMPSYDVVSPEVTVIVHYEVNITNKEMNEVGVNNSDNAVLPCMVVGNPFPVTMWYGPNNTEITDDSEDDRRNVTTDIISGDSVYGFVVYSNLTIRAVNSQVDYGVYTCISSNGIGGNDSLEITLTGTRRPDKPTRVDITKRTAESLTVTWTEGYDGGAEQSFRVYYRKMSDKEEIFIEETGGKTSDVMDLEAYTEYEIRVYAKNSIGENNDYASTKGHTLPKAPDSSSGITVGFNKKDGTVAVGGLKEGIECIQLEVQYEGDDTWQKCGVCITSDQTVTLPDHCASSQRRRRRAVGDIKAVRSKLCIGGLCSQPADAKEVIVTTPDPTSSEPNVALIVGASVGGVVLVAIIVVLVVYLVRTSPKKRSGKEDSPSCANDIQEVELQEPNHDVQPEENNGITNEALLNNDTYAQVNKTKLPPKPQSARSAPTNLPDVTYAEVNKDKKPKPPHDDYAAKKKPKKYVPPSSRAAEESAYEEVQISDKDKAKSPPAADSADTYASVGGQQDTSGRVVTEDGLIYAEVGHMKQHPVDQPPIQTEESTEYASLDFARMKPEDK